MRDFLLNQGLKLFMPLITGFLVPPAMRGLKALSDRLATFPPEIQRVVVVFLAGVGTGLTTFLSVQVTGDITVWDGTAVSTVLSAAIAFAIHAAQKAKEAVAATA